MLQVVQLLVLGLTTFSAEGRPHIILIVADDLGWNDVSFHGSQQIPTPNIDDLARQGIILNNYYVSPICTPTRGSLMTGKYPIHLGLQHGVIYGSQPYGLPLSEKIMPQWLKELGYATHIIGKWHLGMFAEEYTPRRRGFDTHYGYYQGAEGYFDHTYEANEGDWGLDWRRNGEVIHNETELYSTELFTEEAIQLINQHNMSQPLFLYMAHQAVHRGNYGDPLQAPQHYVRRFTHIKDYRRRLFAGMVAALDNSVGLIKEALKQKQMLNNCVIVFTTDNGGPANGYDSNAASNFPLRGVKATLWEGGMRGSGFIYSPLLRKKGYMSNHMMHVSDWLPTLYTAAGGNASNMGNIDGMDFWKSLNTNQTSPRTEILHNIDPLTPFAAALRDGDYKLIIGDAGMKWSGWYPPWGEVSTSPQGGYQPLNFITKRGSDRNSMVTNVDENVFVRKNISSVTIDCGMKPFNASTNCNPIDKACLFNIVKDPCEYYNIADANGVIVDKMLDRLRFYYTTMIPPGNLPEDPVESILLNSINIENDLRAADQTEMADTEMVRPDSNEAQDSEKRNSGNGKKIKKMFSFSDEDIIKYENENGQRTDDETSDLHKAKDNVSDIESGVERLVLQAVDNRTDKNKMK